jgi:DNA polymerase III subunit delta'
MPLDGIVGNREIVAAILAELSHRPSHAYLFSGPRGVGKSLIAQGLAHSILCERAPGPGFCCTPEHCATRIAAAGSGRGRAIAPQVRCECCPACVQAALGVHPDFNLVVRQANRTEVLIEQVRGLIERLGLKPSRAPRRVAIVDDAETLNLPAQNALLKTLEEPPGHTIIFLVTQSERALLDTVRSRMRPVRFGPLEAGEIATVLVRHGGVEAGRAAALARLARGSLSRAMVLSEGVEPPIGELLAALGRAGALDFVGAQELAQEFFGSREQAIDNFELIARLLEEMLCFKLLRAELTVSSPEVGNLMSKLAESLDVNTIAQLATAALKAAAAVDGMANARLQAENWWMAAGRALRSS